MEVMCANRVPCGITYGSTYGSTLVLLLKDMELIFWFEVAAKL